MSDYLKNIDSGSIVSGEESEGGIRGDRAQTAEVASDKLYPLCGIMSRRSIVARWVKECALYAILKYLGKSLQYRILSYLLNRCWDLEILMNVENKIYTRNCKKEMINNAHVSAS